jgi:Flp pilus assembly pilin Flp
MKRLLEACAEFWFSQEAATAVEYGLLTALVALVVVGALALVANELKNTFEIIETHLGGV